MPNWKDKRIHVILYLNGWETRSETIKSYLKTILGFDESKIKFADANTVFGLDFTKTININPQPNITDKIFNRISLIIRKNFKAGADNLLKDIEANSFFIRFWDWVYYYPENILFNSIQNTKERF